VLQIDEKNSTCSVDHEDPALETGIVPACSAMRFHASLLVHGAGVQVYIRELRPVQALPTSAWHTHSQSPRPQMSLTEA